MLLEIVLTIVAWCRGWLGYALIPIAGGSILGFLFGLAGVHGAGVPVFLVEIIALVIMIATGRKNTPAVTGASRAASRHKTARYSVLHTKRSHPRPHFQEHLLNEETLYDQAAREVAEHTLRRGLYAKAFTEASGDEKLAVATYISYRVAELKREHENRELVRRQEWDAQMRIQDIQRTREYIPVFCPSCGSRKLASTRLIGKEIACSQCKVIFTVNIPEPERRTTEDQSYG